ncbi:sigma-54-dependent Fis family transcriptional regulator [Iodidimonas muriae]|uniref:Sigma-54-dependent Fis family transcriptional regulator n=1 Tax=Iodidimonas muriae TaxID=261467 RepID=A0ABQ2L7Q6_9PROT|nr:sigma-54 dependent transcriptional regulator [Iodidimonas muriae]GER08119.1 sigma-54-dependent Fis family transcriptional regulator [Kordiimonadales bacterium JCM 17843]GGO06126.1 sigma-54-dependent Fis family transcriptional regulator [Iodidimonas muriae]
MALDILIVDDEADIRDLVAGILSDEGYQTRVAHDCDSALAQLEARRPSLVILDIWLQGSRLDGLEVLELIKRRHPDLPVVIISGHGNVETAVSAIKRGAYDFIEKPFKSDQLLFIVSRATEAEELRRENEDLKRRVGLVFELTGDSAAIHTVRQSIERVAPTNSRVLFSGPPGSGKEVAARLLHARSKRFRAPFVIVSAASMEPQRMEQELFGVERDGGLVKTGLFERAHGGTLFIDEVSDMPTTTQAKILRVLTEQTFERVGSNTRVQVDVRVVSASSRDLRREIELGRFREDLFHRLSVVPIRVPSLSERREDIPLLADHFVKAVAAANGRLALDFAEPALAALQAYDWPGNVRQLRNVIERMLIMAPDGKDAIDLGMLPADITSDADDLLHGGGDVPLMTLPLREAREVFEKEYLRVQITRFSGNISKTANFIGMERSALHRKLKNLGLTTQERRLGEDESV